MVQFNIENVKKAKEFLDHFNSFNLEVIELFENDVRLDIEPEQIEEWNFIGLNNTDFVMMEVYKDKQ
jgi:hypothetical protein